MNGMRIRLTIFLCAGLLALSDVILNQNIISIIVFFICGMVYRNSLGAYTK